MNRSFLKRSIRGILAMVVLATAFVLAPTPHKVWASEMVTDSLHPEPVPAGDLAVDPASVAPPAAVDDEDAGNNSDADQHDSDVSVASEHAQTEDLLLVADEVDPFVTIGVGFDTGEPTDVVFRVAEADQWSSWRHLEFSDDHRPDDDNGPVRISEPFFVGNADAYEIQFPPGLGEPEVYLVREQATQVEIEWSEDEAGADPFIRTRASWGARSPKVELGVASSLKLAVVHHSVNSNGYSAAQVPALLRSIQAFHMDARGWDDIGYNFLVDRFGHIWEARGGGIDKAVIGGHAYAFNTGSTGVVALGDYASASPSNATVTAISDLIAWKFAQHHVDPNTTTTYRPSIATHFGPAGTPVTLPRVVGHRDVRQTSCPGTRLYAKLGTIRSGIPSRQDAHSRTAPPTLLGGDRTGDRRGDVFVYRPGPGPDRDHTGVRGPRLSTLNRSVSGRYKPVMGDFDGNGIDDIFWYAAGPAPDYVWYGLYGAGYYDHRTQVHGEYRPLVGDFDGDGRDDIFWYGEQGGPDSIWWGSTNGFVNGNVSVNGNRIPLLGDFDGDGSDDIFWYGPGSTGDEITWGGSRHLSTVPTSVNGRYQPFVGDFDGNGADDIFWYAPGPAPDYVWFTSGRQFLSVQTGVNGHYQPIVGDFDGDGRDDVMWYAPGPAPDFQWLFLTTGMVSLSQPVSGHYEAIAVDVDGNGRDEILWVANNGTTYLWSRSARGDHVSTPIA